MILSLEELAQVGRVHGEKVCYCPPKAPVPRLLEEIIMFLVRGQNGTKSNSLCNLTEKY